jgi:hypothetical protein
VPKKITLYVADKYDAVVKKAKEVFKREGSSMSDFLMQELDQYVRLHEPGNPQQRMDVIIETGHTYTAPLICGRCKKENVPVLYEAVFTSGLKLKECKTCFEAAKEHGLVKKFIRLIPAGK